ncbi:MAG: decaprenyl-phosphate phosphoribosyltransferase, partial [Myxococcales bacterium]|nr:decaprenyl-phosphate phosphoribosyltransferase [Myxococcales bacterium]
ITYIVYTLDPLTAESFGTKYLVATAPMPLFGVWRFLYIIRSRPGSESPTEEMLRDLPFLANLLLWGVAVLAVIYLG